MTERIVRTDRYSTTDAKGNTRILVAEVFTDGICGDYVKVSTDIFAELLGPDFTQLEDGD